KTADAAAAINSSSASQYSRVGSTVNAATIIPNHPQFAIKRDSLGLCIWNRLQESAILVRKTITQRNSTSSGLTSTTRTSVPGRVKSGRRHDFPPSPCLSQGDNLDCFRLSTWI